MQFKRPCRKCGKTYQPTGKFQRLCNNCRYKELKLRQSKKKIIKYKFNCCICGEPCSGNMKVRARKGKDYYFCTTHFNRYLLNSLKEIRSEIKKAKSI